MGMARFDALDLGFAPWARRRCFTSGEAKVSSGGQDVVVEIVWMLLAGLCMCVDLTGLDGNRERKVVRHWTCIRSHQKHV